MAFRSATREGTKALIGIHGGSGGGKTLSALIMARGLVGPDGDIYMGDTESRRGEMYVGHPQVGQYMVQQIEAPYAPQKYADVINEAAQEATKTGRASVVVMDSFSHEWEGVGGVLDMANTIAEANAKRWNKSYYGQPSFGDWREPKQAHKHMLLSMLSAPVHIICCMRSQFKSRQIDKKDFAKEGIQSNKNSEIIRDEFQTPIQDKGFIFEMTVGIELRADNPGVPLVMKCPEMLAHAFPKGQMINNATGEAIAAWCSAGGDTAEKTPDSAAGGQDDAYLIADALTNAQGGLDGYKAFFDKLDATQKRVLTSTLEADPDDFGQEKPVHDRCKALATKADQT